MVIKVSSFNLNVFILGVDGAQASGLAAGKGVLIPSNKEEALKGLHAVMVEKEFGDAGKL